MISEFKSEFEVVVEKCDEDISNMRAARASSGIVENILVSVYDKKTPIQQLATISVPDARTIVIAPWDKSVTKNIEDALRIADIGINPVNEGEIIRMVIPALTEERRTELVKMLGRKVEEYRVSLRHVRDKIKDGIIKAEKEKEISEDEKFKSLADLDNMTSDYNKKIKEIGEIKEKELMTI